MDVFLVRKPIFDRRQSVFAYEILYREQQPHSQEGPLHQMAAVSPATCGE